MGIGHLVEVEEDGLTFRGLPGHDPRLQEEWADQSSPKHADGNACTPDQRLDLSVSRLLSPAAGPYEGNGGNHDGAK